MCRGAKSTFIAWGLVFAVFFLYSPLVLISEVPGKGNLVGFVFDKDGTTPVQGAVIVVKNISTGDVFRSANSDHQGNFMVDGLQAGIYALGVTGSKGDFQSKDLVGIKVNETAKVSVALTPYEKEIAAAAQTVNREQKETGESRIGRVVKYNPQTKEAEVFIERGLLQIDDKVHVRWPEDVTREKNEKTDFHQKADALKVEGVQIKRILAGQNGLMAMAKPCVAGDVLYVTCGGVVPIFWIPLGIASIIAGSAALTTVGEEEPASPVKSK